jgi:Uma2 family endonuclease
MAILMTTSPRVPELCAGDVLVRDEFERRYAAMPDLKKAELIEGVVHMGSPVRLVQHGLPHHVWSVWLGFYLLHTKGPFASDNTTVRLDLDNEPQPDLLLCLPSRNGGRTAIASDGYLEGPPELILEITASSASYDLHSKLAVYRRNGVQEYVVHRVLDDAIDWFVLQGGAYVRQEPDHEGLVRSIVFPGLWLDPRAAIAGDLPLLQAVVARGCGQPEHAAFVQRLARG